LSEDKALMTVNTIRVSFRKKTFGAEVGVAVSCTLPPPFLLNYGYSVILSSALTNNFKFTRGLLITFAAPKSIFSPLFLSLSLSLSLLSLLSSFFLSSWGGKLPPPPLDDHETLASMHNSFPLM
jgi:hypothetical protein